MPTTTDLGPEPAGPGPDDSDEDPAGEADPDRPAGPGDRRRFRLGLTAIGVVAFAWRLGYTLVTKGNDTNLFKEGDAFFYSNVARYLAAGHWYVNPFNNAPAADHPPLTVAVLAPASWVFRRSVHQMVLSQRLTMTVIGTLVVVGVGLLGRLVAGDRVGLVAAAVAAADPNLWMNDAVIMSEAISALLIVGCLTLGYRLIQRPSVGRAAAAGAMIGLTVLARAEIGLFLPFMVLPVLVRAHGLNWVQKGGRLALATLAMVAVIMPWSLWNQTRFHDAVPLSTNDGTTILGANCPRTFDSNITGGWSIACVVAFNVDGIDASQASAEQRTKGIDYAKAHADRIPVVLLAREGRTFGFWRPDQSVYINMGEGRPEWASWSGFAVFWALVPVSIAGVFGLRRRRVSLVPLAACLVCVVAVSGLFYGIPRFRLPVDLATCLLTAVVVEDLWLRVRGRAPVAADGVVRPSASAAPPASAALAP